MKKFFFVCIVAAIVAIFAGACSTKVDKCECAMCQVCDSLDYYSTERDAKFDLYYDSLTNMVFQDIATNYYLMDDKEFINHVYNEYYMNESFMNVLCSGWDGLCGDVYDVDSASIDKFYDLIGTFDKIDNSSRIGRTN